MNSAARPLSWTQWLKVESAHWLFVARTVIAMLLALLIALRLDLNSPGSAAVTVSIIALPQAGQVLEKSFYRLLGTLVGAAVTLLLLAMFVQQRDTFIIAVAVWVGLCTAASSYFRGFQAYAWLLCGYTTCLVGFPGFMAADHAFDIAVDRVTIVAVGILSAGVVSTVLLPVRSTDTLIDQVRQSFIDFVRFLDEATQPGDSNAGHARQHRFSEDLARLEAMRGSSSFEDPHSRIRSNHLSAYIGRFMRAGSRVHLLRRRLDQAPSEGIGGVMNESLSERAVALRAALRVSGEIPARASEARPVVAQLDELLAGWPPTEVIEAMLLRDATVAARDLADAYATLHMNGSRGAVSRAERPRIGFDVLQAGLSGLRVAFVVCVTCAFWIASAWPDGFSMALIGTVGCALFSSAPNPAHAALQMCKGFLVAIPALMLCFVAVLPSSHDIGQLGWGLAPFLVIGAWLMSRPGGSLLGSGYYLMFLTGLNLTAVMNFDTAALLNNTLSLAAGIGVAVLGLAVIQPADRTWRPARARQLLIGTLRLARRAKLAGLPLHFESVVRDRSLQLTTLRTGAGAEADAALAVAVLEVGDALIRIRDVCAGNEPRDITVMLDEVLAAALRQDGASLAVLPEESPAFSRRESTDVLAPGIELLRLAVTALAAALTAESAHAA